MPADERGRTHHPRHEEPARRPPPGDRARRSRARLEARLRHRGRDAEARHRRAAGRLPARVRRASSRAPWSTSRTGATRSSSRRSSPASARTARSPPSARRSSWSTSTRASATPRTILAADIFQRHVLLGPVTEGASVGDVALRLYVNGEEVAAADDVTEATGDLDGLVAPRRQDAQGGRRDARARRHGDLRLDRARARRRRPATRSRSASSRSAASPSPSSERPPPRAHPRGASATPAPTRCGSIRPSTSAT